MSLKPWQINRPLTNPVETPAPVIGASPLPSPPSLGVTPSLPTPALGGGLSTVPTNLITAPSVPQEATTSALNSTNLASTNALTTSTGLGMSTTSPYSSLGGYGGYGGYGGMGGYSSFGGMGMGMMGMGMMGMGMTGMTPDSFVYKSMRFMESAGFLVSNVSQISRSVEGHADGISNLYRSIVGLASRVRGWVVSGVVGVKDLIFWVVNRLLVLLKLRKKVEAEVPAAFEGLTDDEIELRKLKRKERLLGIAIQVLIVGILGMLILANLTKGKSAGQSVASGSFSELEAVFQAHNKP